MNSWSLIVCCILIFANWARADVPIHPEPHMTPGHLCTRDNPDFLDYRYQEHIAHCVRKVSTALKNKIYQRYGIPRECHSDYTIDHYIPLSIGGSNSAANLWPEHRTIKKTRPDLEEEIFHRLQAGEITQSEAVALIVTAKNDESLERLHFPPCSAKVGSDGQPEVNYQDKTVRF